jgi:hypothetical protein
MLTGTKARVRTNYGDTEEFEIEQGVTQGGVLSALLFTIFMAQETSTSPMKLEGMKLLTQFFADDCTLIAQDPEAREVLMREAVRWANRWNMIS